MSPSNPNLIELSPMIGTEIAGVQLGALSDDDLALVKATLADRGVVFFRDQHLEPEAHLGFARRLGTIDVNAFFTPVEGYPEVATVVKEPEDTGAIGQGWHTDHSYDTAPAMGSILYALETPPVGGDTVWASMAAAFDALSDGLKDTLRSLRAVHTTANAFSPENIVRGGYEQRLHNPDAMVREATHPVVIRHPDSGREVLYVNPGFTVGIEGWSAKESASLLSFLFDHATDPLFTVRFRWEPGSVAIWDNRSTWHRAMNDYHGHRRLMHRVTVAGCELSAA